MFDNIVSLFVLLLALIVVSIIVYLGGKCQAICIGCGELSSTFLSSNTPE